MTTAWFAFARLEAFSRADAVLVPNDRARAVEMRLPRRRAEFLAGRALLRAILTRVAGERAGRASITVDAQGALHLAGQKRWCVNISHSPALVAAAICKGAPVGIDVEDRAEGLDVPSLLTRFAHPDEAAEVQAAASPRDRLDRFFRLWTLKEAAVKAIGKGLGTDFRRFRVERAAAWRRVEGLDRPCLARPLESDGDSFAAIAMATSAAPHVVDESQACAALLTDSAACRSRLTAIPPLDSTWNLPA